MLDRSVIFLEQWVPYAERGAYLAEADVGVSAHLAGVETHFAFPHAAAGLSGGRACR